MSIHHYDKADPHCFLCDGTGWVCENHPEQPWGGMTSTREACECGAGAPCRCNPLSKVK